MVEGQFPTCPPKLRRRPQGARHEINPWLTAGALLTRLGGSKHRERVAALASCSPAKEGFLFLDGTNAIGGHKMLRTLMISAAASALMVSGALAAAEIMSVLSILWPPIAFV